MHFVGPDQRHGYSSRIAGDRTPVFHNGVPAPKRPDGSPSRVTGFDENGSVRYIGAGDSPVLAYDRYVVQHALDYLAAGHRDQMETVRVRLLEYFAIPDPSDERLKRARRRLATLMY